MKELIILVDYKGHFGSKNNAVPYLSGMILDHLVDAFKAADFKTQILHFNQVDFQDNWKDKYVIYTSQEDKGGRYKSYINDVIHGLELSGAILIPRSKFLLSHNDKVLMEIIRDQSNFDLLLNLKARHYGSWEEIKRDQERLTYPIVVKSADGAMSKGVKLARNISEVKKAAKSLLPKDGFYFKFKEQVRGRIHKNYIRESNIRGKLILQNFIPGLQNDWKILIFGNRFFVFKRNTRANDFRASGSGHDGYLYGSEAQLPEGALSYAKKIHSYFDVPCLSLDIAFDGKNFYLFEFQAIYFGTVGHWRSDCHYEYKSENESFELSHEQLALEEIYTEAIVWYIKKS